jgi:hypothetical protein
MPELIYILHIFNNILIDKIVFNSTYARIRHLLYFYTFANDVPEDSL